MKCMAMLVTLIVSAMFNMGQASAAEGKLNPITRVVQLLEGLAKKVEQDGKMEEDLYDAYVCWATTVIKTKTASNEAAKSRIEELNNYIDDIESGRVEFTSERADLEASIKDLNGEIEEADDMRDKEAKDYAAAKDEMEKAIAALEQAVEVLATATKGKEASMLTMKREVETFREGMHTGAQVALKNAITLGQRYLSKGDALFLERVLTGEVPKADWKKLNRKSTFKMKYKARSGKIQQILADMLKTFKDNLADATKKEEEAGSSHEKLMESKKSELKGQQDALTNGDKEGNARQMAKDEAKTEVEDLTKQVEADEGYIKDTKEALATKKEEWKERKKLRTLEIKSINDAIAILNSDEARDTMKSSFKSQGYLLLQRSATVRQRISGMLRKIAISAKDPRLARLGTTVLLQAEEGPLDEVIKMIDEMIETLQEEENTDLEQKEQCEKDREEQTASARKLSVQIDDFTDEITKNTARIAELQGIIETKTEEIAQMKKDLETAKRAREDEKAAFEADLADDEKAAELVGKAMEVLQGFYKEMEAGFIQLSKGKAPGQAPPPPPPTWDAPYSGAKGESNGIQAILGMIKEDIESDIAKAKKAEADAIAEYEKFVEDTNNSIKANQKAINDMEAEISECEQKIEAAKEERTTAKGTLDSVMEEIKVAQPGCEFICINFETRKTNRQMEIDGLKKAKAILQGGSFDAGPDPNREIKPGDSL